MLIDNIKIFFNVSQSTNFSRLARKCASFCPATGEMADSKEEITELKGTSHPA
jgi:hypothetical protein